MFFYYEYLFSIRFCSVLFIFWLTPSSVLQFQALTWPATLWAASRRANPWPPSRPRPTTPRCPATPTRARSPRAWSPRRRAWLCPSYRREVEGCRRSRTSGPPVRTAGTPAPGPPPPSPTALVRGCVVCRPYIHCNENPIYIFSLLPGNCARPQSQFPHSCVCVSDLYIPRDRSTYFPAAGYRQTDPGNM